MKIQPTIGRVVWFTPSSNSADARFTAADPKQKCAAIVAYVWGEGEMVNLHVIDHNGNGHSRTSVPLIQENEPKPEGYYCEWMPYQIGQAKANEERK